MDKSRFIETIFFSLIMFTTLGGYSQHLTPKAYSLKFDFGAGQPAPGYKQVTPSSVYTTEAGYGYDFGTLPLAVARKGEDPLRNDFVTSTRPFYFSVALREGNYNVAITIGDMKRKATTTVKVESRRLVIEKLETSRGDVVTKTFTVHVKSPSIDASENIRLDSNVLKSLDWDDKLTFEFNDVRPCLSALEIIKANFAITVFLAGNSSVDQEDEPWASWGQMLPRYFKQGVAIANHAEPGLSLVSYISLGHFRKVLTMMKAGDYMFIEFGHEDQQENGPNPDVTLYKDKLKTFINEVRKKKGIPVLITPANRRTFDDNGKISNSLGDYAEAVRKTAKEEKVALIDLNAMTKIFYESLGEEKSKKAFVHYPVGTYRGQDTELKDDTRSNAYGAYELAKCIVTGIRANKLGIARYIVENTPVFDPAHPDAVESWSLSASPKRKVLTPDEK